MRQQAGHLRGEDEYFHELDVELSERISRRAHLLEKRHRLEESVHIHQPAVLDALASLDFDETTANLLFLVPLVQVAWATGPPNRAVRRYILALANRHGAAAGTMAGERLLAWLDRRPPDTFLDGTLNVLARFLFSLPQAERSTMREELLSACRETAAVHCRLLHWSHRICAAKRRMIAGIRRRLETEPQTPS